MAGLLDFLNSDDARLGMGLLAAGAPQTDPSKTGLGYAMQQGVASVDAAKKARLADLFTQSQIAENAGQAQLRQQQAAAAVRKQQALASAVMPDGSINPYALLQGGYAPEDISKIGDFGNFGKPEVTTWQEARGPNNEPGKIGYSKTGQPVTPFVASAVKAEMQNVGNQIVPVNPYTAQQTGAGLAVNVSPDAQLSSDTAIRNADQQAVTARGNAQMVDNRAAITAGINAGKLTESEGKSLLFGTRMAESNSILDDLQQKGVLRSVPGSTSGFGIGATVGALQPGDWQRLDQAKRDFLNATLRRESGAVISPSEFTNGNTQYFPQVGDGPDVIAQKKRNREIAVQGVTAEVPNAAERMATIRQGLTPMPTPSATTPVGSNAANPQTASKFVTVNGTQTMARRAPDGRYYVQTPKGWAPVQE